MVAAAKRLEIKEEDLRPVSPKEMEEYRRKLRQIKLKRATSNVAKGQDKT
jgi:hypothetical protein